MTNDEAINTLKNAAWLGWSEQEEKVSEAVKMAVEALKAQPEERTDKHTETHACDCVSRQAAIDALKPLPTIDGLGLQPLVTVDDAIKVLNDLPSVQPESKWIPVTERLPEPRTDVWVNSDIGQIQGYYEENVKIWYASFGQGRDYLELIVNAWMPLPEPYREEGGK